MRSTRWSLLAVLAALLLGGPQLLAATAPAIKLVRIGLPVGRAGEESGRSRNGAWAPVAVTLVSGSAGHPQDTYRLRIETTDLEELAYQYTVPVPAMSANSERTVQGYIVPGSDGAVFRVQVETLDGSVVSVRDKISRDANRDEMVGDHDVLVLGAGGGLSLMQRAAAKADKPEKEKEDDTRGRRQFVFADDAGALPDRWFGYDAVDVVVLATGKVDFVNQLSQDAERREALLEWVRRGGQLVISVGRNQQAVGQLLARAPFTGVKLGPGGVVPELKVLSREFCDRPEQHKRTLQQVETAKIEPGNEVHVVVREASGPILVQASCGLGRVVLVGFDLDMAPFLTWDGQDAFWNKLHTLVTPSLAVRRGVAPGGPVGMPPGGPGGPAGPGIPGMMDPAEYDLRGELKRGLETFEEVPVISFLWVTLFVLFYIALVGPLDYFVLKKVFKRLELTWITFPLTALLVSGLAYLVAYSMKGDELRINKIDLVDVDMHRPRQAYGHSWFTLFSPRAQSYTVGIEPAVGTWTKAIPASSPGPVVTLLEGGDRTPRQGTAGLFNRPYEYADDATGLVRVPVPVWSTRSFTASWRAPLLDKKPPIDILADDGPLRTVRGGSELVGRLTNNLPVTLRDVCLFYEDGWYYLGDLAPNEQRRVDRQLGARRQMSEWYDATAPDGHRFLAPRLPVAPSGRALSGNFTQERGSYALLKAMMFFQRSGHGGGNAGLRSFDQSWRLGAQLRLPPPERELNRDEVILIARAPLYSDRAETVAEQGAAPCNLWLGELPGPDRQRPALRGLITQETFLRVFIPVQRER